MSIDRSAIGRRCGALLLFGALLPVTAVAGEPDVRAGLRLPTLGVERSDEQLSDAVFTSLTPFTIEEVPVRLPADQRLDNAGSDENADRGRRDPNAR
ncbi:MAG: hypothetical protein NXH85_06870 [Pseudomonadaceae bacterium]|nr:hypothetical protein [Pseudomonadaceae bacterium]